MARQCSLLWFVLAWRCSVAFHGGTNPTNVSADPASFDPRGATAVIDLGLLKPTQVRRGALVSFPARAVFGRTLVWMCDWTFSGEVAAGYFCAGPSPIFHSQT
jgi:hypothetical protein